MIKLERGAFIPRIFWDNTVTVCFSANNAYVPQTAVMLKSLIEHSSSEKNYEFIILSTDIDSENEAELAGYVGARENISVRIFDISYLLEGVTFFTDSVYTPTTYSKEAYFRLFIPFAMPEHDKAIYFDGDMVAAEDVSPLMDIDMTEYLAAATRDFSGIAACYDPGSDRLTYRKSIGIKEIDRYFISSMVVLNIKMFNELYTLENLKKLISSRKWRQHDQDILNVLCQDRLLIVGAEWSFFEEFDYAFLWLSEDLKNELLDAKKIAKVIHYAGDKKAWIDEKSELTEHFWKYAHQTKYFEQFFYKIGSESAGYRKHILSSVLNQSFLSYKENNDTVFTCGDYIIGKLSHFKACIEHVTVDGNKVHIEGFHDTIDEYSEFGLYPFVNGKRVGGSCTGPYRTFMPGFMSTTRSFEVTLTLDPEKEENTVCFKFSDDGERFVMPFHLSVDQFAPINEHPDSFCPIGNFILTKPHGNYFIFESYSKDRVRKLNKKLCTFLFQKRDKYFTKMALLRKLSYFRKLRKKNKSIWLISDTDVEVSDRAVALFKHLNKIDDIIPYFVAPKNSDRIDELKKIGKVLTIQSKKHKILFFNADVVIASKYDTKFFMPSCVRANEIRDLIAEQRFIYWHKDDEDLSYNIRPWHNVEKFILHDKVIYNEMIEADNGYEEDNFVYIDINSKKEISSQIYEAITKR